ncbi:hypothetical protein HMPREF1349_02985 [Enterococcus faecium 506]|nr:hypothetical protein HMPREF1349_02985 [Enterococcus faecium 506]
MVSCKARQNRQNFLSPKGSFLFVISLLICQTGNKLPFITKKRQGKG